MKLGRRDQLPPREPRPDSFMPLFDSSVAVAKNATLRIQRTRLLWVEVIPHGPCAVDWHIG